MKIYETIQKMLAKRKSAALYYLLASTIAPLLLVGIPFGLMGYLMYNKTIGLLTCIIRSYTTIYLFVGAPFTIAAILLSITKIERKWCTRYGCALYYGTYILNGPLRNYPLSFAIILVITTIFYAISLKKKQK